MRYEEAAADPQLYEAECLRHLRRGVGPRPPGPERDHLAERGLTWLSVDYEGAYPATTIVVTVEDRARNPSIIEYRFELWGPVFRRSGHGDAIPFDEQELQADPERVWADVWDWVNES
jgi:hypothetical protein